MTILLLTSSGQDLAQQRARSCPASKKLPRKMQIFYNLITKRMFITLSQSHRKAFERKFVHHNNKHLYLYCIQSHTLTTIKWCLIYRCIQVINFKAKYFAFYINLTCLFC